MNFSNTIEYITGLFKKKKEETTSTSSSKEEQPQALPTEILLNELDFSSYGLPIITNEDKPTNLLIVDDYDLTNVLFSNDFKAMTSEFNHNPNDDFKIYRCLNKNAGYQAWHLVSKLKTKIDYALLDLTLGLVVKLPNGEFIDIDGAELACKILEVNPEAKILFVSAHTNNKENYILKKYSSKLIHCGLDLYSNYCHKSSPDRYKTIHDFLYNKVTTSC